MARLELGLVFALAACSPARTDAPLTSAARDSIKVAVLAVLDSSQDAENRHDANGIMEHWLSTEDYASATGGSMLTSFRAFDSIARRNISRVTHTRFEWRDRRVAVLGRDAAHVLATFVMTSRDSTGQDRYVRGDWGVVFIRRAGRWWMIRDQGSEVTDSVRPGRP